jgi:phage shock protein PspC (stress-responsive transcriptional regulator)
MSNLTATREELKMMNETPLPLRNDTILGVCEAIGQDFGFNPLWLRLAFIAPIFFAPALSIGAYLGLGVVVAATRLLVRDRKPAEVSQLVSANNAKVEDDDLPIAA